jgi:hypothetical protein
MPMKSPKLLRLSGLVAVSTLAFSLAGGCVYTNIQVPLSDNYDRTQVGCKSGRASSHIVLWLVAWGDAGSHAAAKEGDITTIYHADRQIFSLLFGTYTRTTTVIYGE